MSERSETLLKIEGMTCGHCVRHVDEALRALDGVAEVEVRLAEGEALVRHDARAPVAGLVEAVREAGYEAAAGQVTGALG